MHPEYDSYFFMHSVGNSLCMVKICKLMFLKKKKKKPRSVS